MNVRIAFLVASVSVLASVPALAGHELGNRSFVPEPKVPGQVSKPTPGLVKPGEKAGPQTEGAAAVVFRPAQALPGDAVQAITTLSIPATEGESFETCVGRLRADGLVEARVLFDACRVERLDASTLRFTLDLKLPSPTAARSYLLTELEWGSASGKHQHARRNWNETLQVVGPELPSVRMTGFKVGTGAEALAQTSISPGGAVDFELDLASVSKIVDGTLRFAIDQGEGFEPAQLPLSASEWLELVEQRASEGRSHLKIRLRLPKAYRLATALEIRELVLLNEALQETTLRLPVGFGVDVVPDTLSNR